MKNKFLSLILLMLVNLSVNGQSNSWILGSRYIPTPGDIPQSLPIPIVPDGNPYNGYDNQVAQNAQNIITEANGQIRFFIVDGFIYDRNGFLIDEMTASVNSIFVNGFKGQTAAIPLTGSCDEYLIISTCQANQNIMSPLGSKLFYGRFKVKYMNNGLIDPCSGFIPFIDPQNLDESLMTDLADISGSEYFATNNVHDEYHKFAVTKNTNGIQTLFVSNHD